MTVEHDTVNKQMIHDFGNGNQLVTDFRMKTSYLMHCGEVKDRIDISEMLVTDYMGMIFGIEKSLK